MGSPRQSTTNRTTNTRKDGTRPGTRPSGPFGLLPAAQLVLPRRRRSGMPVPAFAAHQDTPKRRQPSRLTAWRRGHDVVSLGARTVPRQGPLQTANPRTTAAEFGTIRSRRTTESAGRYTLGTGTYRARDNRAALTPWHSQSAGPRPVVESTAMDPGSLQRRSPSQLRARERQPRPL